MFVTLEKTKEWLRVESNDEDALIERFITTAEDIVGGILRFPLSEFEEVPETVEQAVCFAVSVMFEQRESLDIVALMATLRGMMFAYRKDAW
ncbi:MAG: head-tail connector protein [Bacillota bacterium]